MKYPLAASLCALILLNAGAVSSRGQDLPVAPAPAEKDAVPDVTKFVRDSGGRLSVPVRIGGNGPYNFFVDTGAERTIISRELAARLTLGSGGSVIVHSMSGVGRVETALIPKLRISSRTMRYVHAPMLDAINIGGAGMLGVDSLKSRRLLLDFAGRRMSVTPSSRYDETLEPGTIVVTARSRFGRLMIAHATVEGEKVLVVLDTGSQVTIGNQKLREVLLRHRKLATTTPIQLISVVGDTIAADYTTIKRMTVGGVRMNDVPIAFADVHPFKQLDLIDQPAVFLGMDALQLFSKVSLDFAKREVQFVAPQLRG